MKFWIFDLDGTIVDSFEFYFRWLEDALKQPLSAAERKLLIGLHPKDFLYTRLPKEEADQALGRLALLDDQNSAPAAVFHEVVEVCAWLEQQQCKMAVLTSRDLKSTRNLLARHGLDRFFTLVVSGDCVSKRKPDLEGIRKIQQTFACKPQDVVVVGDHDMDMQVAVDFGATGIRASWHQHWQEEACQRAKEQFHSAAEFLDWVKSSV